MGGLTGGFQMSLMDEPVSWQSLSVAPSSSVATLFSSSPTGFVNPNFGSGWNTPGPTASPFVGPPAPAPFVGPPADAQFPRVDILYGAPQPSAAGLAPVTRPGPSAALMANAMAQFAPPAASTSALTPPQTSQPPALLAPAMR
jgi:hypothetical protein